MAGGEPEPSAQAPTRRVSGRAWLAGVLLTLLGVLIVIAAPDALNVAPGSYWEGVIANVGVAVLLAGPLLLAERAISGQLNRVDRRVEAARRDSRQARAEVQRGAAPRCLNPAAPTMSGVPPPLAHCDRAALAEDPTHGTAPSRPLR
jgi:hypothetical protein